MSIGIQQFPLETREPLVRGLLAVLFSWKDLEGELAKVDQDA